MNFKFINKVYCLIYSYCCIYLPNEIETISNRFQMCIDYNSISDFVCFVFFFSLKMNIYTQNVALPEILASDLKDQSIYETCPVSFEIIAQGIPKLDAQWTLNDKPLKADEHYNITEDGLKYKLSIPDVKLTDAGLIKIVVKNKLGELSKECKLSVMRKY